MRNQQQVPASPIWLLSGVVIAILSGCLAELGEPADQEDNEFAPASPAPPIAAFDEVVDIGPSECTGKHETPPLRGELELLGDSPGMTYSARMGIGPDGDEEDAGLDPTLVVSASDQLRVGVSLPLLGNPVGESPPKVPYDLAILDLSAYWAFLFSDWDGDCLLNYTELDLGTNYLDPDTDHDGWFDGPCNERRKLVLERIKAHDEQEDIGEDELYLIADDIRFPNSTWMTGGTSTMATVVPSTTPWPPGPAAPRPPAVLATSTWRGGRTTTRPGTSGP